MTESVRTVLGYLRSNAARHRLDDAHFARDLFVHAPDAASPKDGPSAGIAIAVALVSAMRGEAASARVAMTGEVSLSGDVLPVGGVRAKLLAAERAGVTKVIIPKENEHDVPTDVRVEIVLVSRVADAIDAAFQGVSSAPSTSISAASTTTGTPA
jgi:ATP-dependent Lon protease